MTDLITEIKIVLVGPRNAGKTSILTKLSGCQVPHEYLPRVLSDKYQKLEYREEHGMVDVQIYDTAYTEDDKTQNPLRHNFMYPGTHCFVLCFSLSDRESYNSARTFWRADLEEHGSGVPVLLVGTKDDLSDQVVGNEEVVEFTREIGSSVGYVKVSSHANTGVSELYYQSIDVACKYRGKLKKKDKAKGRKCVIC